MLERGSTKVYYGTSKNEYIGTLEGTVVHVTHTYKMNADGMLEITTVVTDGVGTVTYTKAVASDAKTTLYWDIYTATEAGKATMDNFALKSAEGVVDSAAELVAAIENGGEINVSADIELAQNVAIEIPAETSVTLNMNGKTVSGTNASGALVVNGGDLAVTGGTFVNNAVNGAAVISNSGTLELNGTTVVGAPMSSTGYPAYAISTSGELIVNEGTTVTCDRGAISMSDGANVVINGGSIVVSDAADGRNMTLHTIYAYGYNSTLTINGGNLEQNHSSAGGASVICPAGAKINIFGGNFSYLGEAGSQSGIFQNYMGYGVKLNVQGGTYNDTTVNKNLADGYTAINNGDGTYTVVPKLEGEATLSPVEGYPHLFTDGADYYAYDAQGLISMRNFWGDHSYHNDMWGRSYNIMADIDATGYTWNEVWLVVGSNDNKGFVFDGNGHTITGLTINGSLFSGTPNGGDVPEYPGKVQNITFDGAKVVGDHFTAVLWSNVYNELVIENVKVINSEITGKCNVAALVGGTVTEGGDATVKFINCEVKDNIITAEGKDGQDPNGASAFISRAFGDTTLVFEGTNVSEGNTIINNNGLVGGGIYGYSVHDGANWVGTGTCDSFANWSGLSAASDAEALKAANGGNVVLTGTVDLGGTQGNYLTMTENTTIVGGTIKGTGWTGELNYAVNATSGNIVFDGVTFDTTDWTTEGWAKWGISVNVNGTANVIFKNCTFKGAQCPIYLSGADSVITLENCKFETTSVAIQCEIYSGDFTLGENLIVKNCDFSGVADVLHIYDYDKDPTSEAIVEYLTDNSNTFTGVCKQTCK